MTVSVDVKKIEKLKQLEATLELLQNPESYARLLAEVQVALRQYEDLSKRYASVDAADRHLADAQKILESAKDEAKKVMQEVVRQKAEFETMVVVKTGEINTAQAGAMTMVAEATAALNKAKLEGEAVVKAKKEFEDMRASAYKRLEAQEKASNDRARVLDEKWELLKRIAG